MRSTVSNQFISSSQSTAAPPDLSEIKRGPDAQVGEAKQAFTQFGKLHRTPRLRVLLIAVCAVLGALCASGHAQSKNVPSELKFLSNMGKVYDYSPYKAWDSAKFPRSGPHQVEKRGRHWIVFVALPEPKDSEAIWAKMQPQAVQAGWTVISVYRGGGFGVLLSYQHNGIEAWANASMDFGYDVPHVNWEVIEIAPPPISVTLVEPSAKPEKMPTGERGDFPFLTPIPHSVPNGGRDSSAPWSLKWKGSSEMQTVANGALDRSYKYPDLSSLLFGTVYHDALIKAGWDVDQSAPDQPIIAHYAKKGRNLWAYVSLGGDDYTIRVGKEGAPDQLKASLAKDCHVALYGVLFDFNKSTLQPASDGALQQVAALMAANPSLKIEIQGHTDNVGGDAYNQTLSEARAHSVMTWLIAHNVAAARMTAKGYGKTRPVADNNTDEGRMKNRRVEIADPSCKPR
jgi:outer membrane protein OmpA-like peptidoglycan-associated protein